MGIGLAIGHNFQTGMFLQVHALLGKNHSDRELV